MAKPSIPSAAMILRSQQQVIDNRPPSSNGDFVMEPGKTYIEHLPGRTRPHFVRKRSPPSKSGFGLTALARALGSARPIAHPARARSVEGEDREVLYIRSAPQQPQIVKSTPKAPLELTNPTVPRPAMEWQPGAGALPGQPLFLTSSSEQARETQAIFKDPSCNEKLDDTASENNCMTCEKRRLPHYHSRHPIVTGTVPWLGNCRRCIKEYTSSNSSKQEKRSTAQSRNRTSSHRQEKKKRRRHKRTDRKGFPKPESSSSDSSSNTVESKTRATSSHGKLRYRRQRRSSSGETSEIEVSIRPENQRQRKTTVSVDSDKEFRERVQYVERIQHPQSPSWFEDPSSPRETIRYVFQSDGRRKARSRSRSRAPSEEWYRTSNTLYPRNERYFRYRAVQDPQESDPLSEFNDGYEDYTTEPHLVRHPMPRRASKSILAHHGSPPRYPGAYFDKRDEVPSNCGPFVLDRGRSPVYREELRQPPTRTVRIVRVARSPSPGPVEFDGHKPRRRHYSLSHDIKTKESYSPRGQRVISYPRDENGRDSPLGRIQHAIRQYSPSAISWETQNYSQDAGQPHGERDLGYEFNRTHISPDRGEVRMLSSGKHVYRQASRHEDDRRGVTEERFPARDFSRGSRFMIRNA